SKLEKDSILSLWSEIRTDVPPILQIQLNLREPIIDMAWDISSDGQFILAIAFSRKISIYGERRATDVSDDLDKWINYVTFDVDTPDDITGIAWLDYGVLSVAAGNQLRCYIKWLTKEDRIQERMYPFFLIKVNFKSFNLIFLLLYIYIEPPFDPEFEPMSNIYDESYELNGPLPFYHPNLLIHYLMWGKIDLINAVLLSIYRFLRHIIDEVDIKVDQVPQLCISTILKLQNEAPDGLNKKNKGKQQHYSSLFEDSDEEDTTILLGIDDTDETRPLTRQETTFLIEQLDRRQLPGLSHEEKIHLLAMIDTFVEISIQRESLDENGARFTALVENFFHLNKALALEEQSNELAPRDTIWALHSQSQDLLLERCLRLCGGKLLWKDARAMGIFMWLKKSEVVIEQMTNIARNTYLNQEVKDPINCTLYYLALGKKGLLQSLWRTAHGHKEQGVMVRFLANDFSQPRWRTAASKNAFVLLGRQRYEYAAAFFLLGDKLSDAVGVILKNLKDYQLAIAICRVYEGDHSPLLQTILKTHVLPLAKETKDRWLMIMAYSLLEEPHECIRSIIVPLHDTCNETSEEQNHDNIVANVNDPNLFIMYQHLKEQLRLQNKQNLEISSRLEYAFSLNVSRAYERLGCPLLALFILSKCKKPVPEQEEEEKPIKESRAIDLFAEDDDLFKKKESKAIDLFAEEEDIFAPKKEQEDRAVDLFANDDIFADTKTSSTDLFGDDDWLNTTYSSIDHNEEEEQQQSNGDDEEITENNQV
ncbi:hypothetical protein INT45_008392, partial [Circinella minor]